MSNWFDVDKAGLAKLLAGRSKAFVLYELLQNAWDEPNVKRVDVTVEPVAGTRAVEITVSDDAPDGFANLRDAYTLFAESRKKSNVAQRGRFNLGEKLVLALAKSAWIETTTGTVEFTASGERKYHKNHRRTHGSIFRATIAMSKAEREEMLEATKLLIVPAGVVTYVNGLPLADRKPLTGFDAVLPTVVADGEGVLRKTTRRTPVWVFEPFPGETATLYEMGIPVVETGDRFHVDVGQKVPLNMDRDNVTPAYLRQIRVAVLNAMHGQLEPGDTADTWVREACADERVSVEAVQTALTLRFGENAVRYDPSDPEANKRSAAEGRPVVHGGNLTGAEWENANRAGMLPPAGTVTPSPKPYDPDGEPLTLIPEAEWTPGMRKIADYAEALGNLLLDSTMDVSFAREPRWPYGATYGKGRLTFNYSRCGAAFFENGASDDVNRLLIHEFAHHYESDHLSAGYYKALADLGARLTRLALTDPDVFQL